MSMLNLLESPFVSRPYASRMASHVVFTRTSVNSHLQIFTTKQLGWPDILLATYQGVEGEKAEVIDICIPHGEYYIQFVAFTESGEVGIGGITLTEQPCSFTESNVQNDSTGNYVVILYFVFNVCQ